jgi:hypothetical protein
MNMRRLARGPGTQAAIGVITTGLLIFIGGTFLQSRPIVGYVLFAGAAFRLYAVVRDYSRSRREAREDAEWEELQRRDAENDAAPES